MKIHLKTVFDMETGRILSDEFYDYEGPLALADRSLQAQGKQAEQGATTTGGNYGSAAAGIGAQLIPQLQAQATGNVGLTPTQTNNMTVAAEQGAGGATAGITGEAGLRAARTRNSGALSGVEDQASRNRAAAGSQAGLNIQNESAQVARQNQARAQGQLSGLYGTDVSAQLHAMGLQPEDINAEANAGKQGWLQNTLSTIQTLGNLGLGSAKAAGFG